MPNGVIVYEGPSRINGDPIVVILTGLKRKSQNAKTGNMVQGWVMPATVAPVEALKTGADVSVCGGCKHRPGIGGTGRSCYVPMRAPQSIFRAYERGSYPVVTPEEAGELLRGRFIRLGAWGDPAAAPIEVWDGVTAHALGWTGYTHQWANARLRDVLKYCQASVDTEAELGRAPKGGTFRVLTPEEEPQPFEIICPASEAVTCLDCRRCHGTEGANVAIYVHGAHKTNFRKDTA